MKKKVVLIGLISLLLIGLVVGIMINKSSAPEETVLPESGVIVEESAEEPEQSVKELVEESAEEPEQSVLEVIEITVGQLHIEYYKNEISADQKYLNKILRISGNVAKIKRDIATGKPAVYIDGMQGSIRVFVKCVFENEAEVVSLAINQKVVIEGKFVGSRLESVMRMENSSLLK